MAIASGAIAAVAVLALDPDAPFAVGLVIAALSVCVGAAASTLMLWSVGTGRGRSQRAIAALRRGIEVSVIVALLLLLRVVDGLTVITGGFIVLGFVVAEMILSARPGPSSR